MLEALMMAQGAFDVPLPPAQPPMVQERVFFSPAAEAHRREGEFFVRDAQAKFDYWKQQADVSRSRILALAAAMPLAPEVLMMGRETVLRMEDIAEDLARGLVKFEKKARKAVKRQFLIDPSIAAVKRTIAEQYVKLEREKIDAVLEMALFIRATNAMLDPELDAGQIFDNPDDLERALLGRAA